MLCYLDLVTFIVSKPFYKYVNRLTLKKSDIFVVAEPVVGSGSGQGRREAHPGGGQDGGVDPAPGKPLLAHMQSSILSVSHCKEYKTSTTTKSPNKQMRITF